MEMAADALVVRSGRRPFGPEHAQEVGICGKKLGKKALPPLSGVTKAAKGTTVFPLFRKKLTQILFHVV